MSVVLRVIDDDKIKSKYFVEEYLLGLISLNLFDAKSLSIAIVDILKKYDIDLNLCVALCFDGSVFPMPVISWRSLTYFFIFLFKVPQ